MRLKHFFACLLAVALLCGCTPRTAEVQTPPVQSPPEPEQAEPTYSPQPPAPPAHATLLSGITSFTMSSTGRQRPTMAMTFSPLIRRSLL